MIHSTAKVQVMTDETPIETCIHIHGDIDEDAHFYAIQPKKCLILDMAKIRFINSCGLRNWIQWLKTIPPATQVVFRNCPKVIVDQMNILNGFIPPGAVVESFYIPYYCESCGHEEHQLAERGKTFKEHLENKEAWSQFPEHILCPQCKESAEIGVMPTRYFSFLKSKRTA
jgi:anti-anti-sigma regulatory factor/rubredoxin